MARPERFQLPLLVEFGGSPAPDPRLVRRALLDSLTDGQEEMSRFVRVVQEEVQIRSPGDAANYLMQKVYTPFDRFDQEEFRTLLMNTKNMVTHEAMVYRGTITTIHVRLGELFKEAIRVNAGALLISHCHPSGDPTPSPEDVRVTEDAFKVAQLLDIDLLDHIVVGRNRWVSLKERGLGFTRQSSAQ